MRWDTFELLIDSANYISWPGGGGFQPAELRVNGTGLIELVRQAELPHVLREHDERVAVGELAGNQGARAGDYLYLNAKEVLLPSRALLGEPYRHGFQTEVNDPRNRQSLLLSCTCGITDCWFLLATITVTSDAVGWSDFRQFHRSWKYELGPFRFQRSAYEAQLAMQ